MAFPTLASFEKRASASKFADSRSLTHLARLGSNLFLAAEAEQSEQPSTAEHETRGLGDTPYGRRTANLHQKCLIYGAATRTADDSPSS